MLNLLSLLKVVLAFIFHATLIFGNRISTLSFYYEYSQKSPLFE